MKVTVSGKLRAKSILADEVLLSPTYAIEVEFDPDMFENDPKCGWKSSEPHSS